MFFLISGKSRLVKYDYHMARLVYLPYLPRFSWFVWQLSTLRISNQLPRCIYTLTYIYIYIYIYIIYCMYRYILCWCAKCISKTFFSPPIWRPPQVCKSPQLWSKSLDTMYMLHRPIGSMSWYIHMPTFTYIFTNKNQKHLCSYIYTSPMDPSWVWVR